MRLTAMALMRATIVSLLAVPMIGAAQLIRADHDRRIVAQMAQFDHPSPEYRGWVAKPGHPS